MATFTFANGILATLEAAWTINSPRATGPSPKQNTVLRLEIIGSCGEIIKDGLRAPSRAVLAALGSLNAMPPTVRRGSEVRLHTDISNLQD
jgi:hypothetical protein